MHYEVKNYQPGFEQGQARIGIEVARKWVWPFAYDLDDLVKISAQPDFDPATRHYCFLGKDMVGYLFSLISPQGDEGEMKAVLEFPRMLPGHEQAAVLFTGKGISIAPGKRRFANQAGSRQCALGIYPWPNKQGFRSSIGATKFITTTI